MYSRAEMCSESNRKYFSPDKQQRNSEKFRKKLKTHFTDGFVSLVHHLHQLLRSVVKDVLNLFHFWTKTFLWINLNKSHVFLPERHLVFCLCLWKNFLLLLASHLSFCQLSSAPVWHSWVNGIAVQHSAESCLHTSVLNSVAHLVCWTVAEGQDRGERQIPQILGLGASQPPRQHPACASILFTGSFSSHMSPFFFPQVTPVVSSLPTFLFVCTDSISGDLKAKVQVTEKKVRDAQEFYTFLTLCPNGQCIAFFLAQSTEFEERIKNTI